MSLALVFQDNYSVLNIKSESSGSSTLQDSTEQLPISDSIDGMIMDHIDQGIPYFNRCLDRIKSIQGDTRSHRKYLQTYMKIYFNIYNLFLDYHPSTIIEFVDNLRDFDEIEKTFYYKKIYQYCQTLLPSLIKNVNVYEQIYFVGQLMKNKAFRDIFLPLEMENITDARYIEDTTILGWLIYNITDSTIASFFVKTFSPFLIDDKGLLCEITSEYISTVYKLNRHRLYTDQFSRKPCNSEIFLHGVCLILFDIYQDRDDLMFIEENGSLEKHIIKMIEITCNPMLTTYHSLKNQTMNFENVSTTNPMYTYLNRIQQRVQKKVMKYEAMFETIFKTSFDKVMEIYCGIANYLMSKIKTNTSLTGHQEIVVQTIFNFVILVEPVYIFSLDSNDTLPLFQLASHILTDTISINNQGIKLLAFEVVQTLESIHRGQIQVSAQLVESIIKLYNRVPNEDGDFTTTNYRRLIVLFLNRKHEWIEMLDKIDEATFRKFICFLIGETNNLVDSIYTKYQKKVALNKLTIIILKGCKHVHFLEQLVNRYSYMFRDASIYTSFVNFIGYQVHLISAGLNKISMCMPILRSVSRILIDFSSQENFIEKLMTHTEIEKYKETVSSILSTEIVSLGTDKQEGLHETLAGKLIRLENSREKTIKVLMEAIDKKLEDARQSDSEVELPLEFCDPLLCTPIEDPVVIPDTEIIMDRAIITRRLLEEEENPFTRSSLTIQELDDYNNSESAKNLVTAFKKKLDDYHTQQKTQKQETQQQEKQDNKKSLPEV